MALGSFPKLGRLALEAGLVTLEQLRPCLVAQIAARKTGRKVPLGQIMIDRGLMTAAQVEELLNIQHSYSQIVPVDCQEVLEVPAGTVIFNEGQAGDCCMYILLEGAVELRHAGKVIDRRDKKGMFLGEMGALLKTPHLTTAVAVEDCRLCRIESAHVAAFLHSHPTIATKLAESLAVYCREAMEKWQNAPLGADGSSLVNLAGKANLDVLPDGCLVLKNVAEPSSTFVNGYPAQDDTLLHDQDLIQVGRHVLQVFLDHPHRIKLPEELAACDVPPNEPQDFNADAQADLVQPDAEEMNLPEAPEAKPPPPELVQGMTMESAIAAQVDALEALALPQEVLSAVEARLEVCTQICRLDDRRQELSSGILGSDEQMAQELEKQIRETLRIPPLATLEKSVAHLRRRARRT